MHIKGTVEIQISTREIAKAIVELLETDYELDLTDCDFATDNKGNTYEEDGEVRFSSNPRVAALVDAVNVLTYGCLLKMEKKS